MKLLPCPFCGEEGRIKILLDDCGVPRVNCGTCSTEGPFPGDFSRETATNLWNTRAEHEEGPIGTFIFEAGKNVVIELDRRDFFKGGPKE